MKKRNLILAISLWVMILLSSCNLPKATPENGGSLTQVAVFAQATLTKFAEQQAVEAASTQAPKDGSAPVASPVVETVVPTATMGSQAPTPNATAVPPTEVPTATAVPVTPVYPTATSVPVTPVYPTATSGVMPTTPAGVTRVSFATGTTNYTVKETIPANTTKRYALRLTQWQMIEISLKSNTSAYIAVSTEKGKQLVDFSQKWLWYRDYATENGDWYVDVQTGAYAADINLSFIAPQRISFESGKNALIAKASVGGYNSHNFIAWANKDQTMSLSLNPSSGLVLSIRHVNGDVLLAESEGKTSFEGKLPAAGDYIITVSNATAGQINIELNMTIK